MYYLTGKVLTTHGHERGARGDQELREQRARVLGSSRDFHPSPGPQEKQERPGEGTGGREERAAAFAFRDSIHMPKRGGRAGGGSGPLT